MITPGREARQLRVIGQAPLEVPDAEGQFFVYVICWLQWSGMETDFLEAIG